MGQRANLILVEGRDYQLFYSHWCANTLTRDLFWGPAHAAEFIRMQRAVDASGWLDDVWAEGGAVLDFSRKRLLLYGGEDVLHHIPLRRMYLELLTRVWKGWTVRWAYEGIADVADYVGYPRDQVLSKRGPDVLDNSALTPPEQKDWTDLVGSIRFDDGTVRLYPLAGDVASYVLAGPKLAANVAAAQGLPRLLLDEWITEFPVGGFHLDLSARKLEFWLAPDAPGIAARVVVAWPGWETHWRHDCYEMQLERTEGFLRFPSPDRQALLDRCLDTLLWESATSPVDAIKLMVERESEQGKNVQVNAWALRDDRLELSRGERLAILDDAISRL